MKGLKEKGKIYLEILAGRVIDIDNLRTTPYGMLYIKKYIDYKTYKTKGSN